MEGKQTTALLTQHLSAAHESYLYSPQNAGTKTHALGMGKFRGEEETNKGHIANTSQPPTSDTLIVSCHLLTLPPLCSGLNTRNLWICKRLFTCNHFFFFFFASNETSSCTSSLNQSCPSFTFSGRAESTVSLMRLPGVAWLWGLSADHVPAFVCEWTSWDQ